MWVRTTPNGKVKYCERYTDYLTGKTKDVSVTFNKDTARNRREAARILQERIDAKLSPHAKDITLSALIDEYRIDQKLNVRQSTYQRNYHTAETIKELLGPDLIISRMTARYIRNQFQASGKKPGTMNEYLKRLKAIMKWGYKNELINDISCIEKVEPFSDIPHREKISEKYLETNELKEVLNHMDHPVWKLLTEFMALSGLRYGEAAALERSDIDMVNHVIHVNKSYDSANNEVAPAKSVASVDEVVIQPQLEQVIHQINVQMRQQQLIHGYRTNLFLSDTKGEHIHYFAFNKYFREKCEQYIGKKLTTHSLRHTHASLLFENGFTLDEVSRRLRHGDSKVTRDVYIHVTQKLREKDAQKLMKTNLL